MIITIQFDLSFFIVSCLFKIKWDDTNALVFLFDFPSLNWSIWSLHNFTSDSLFLTFKYSGCRQTTGPAMRQTWNVKSKKKQPPHTFICVQRSLLLCWWVWYEPTTILKLTNVNEQFKYENANWHWHSTKLSFKINMQTVINMAFCFDFPILVVRALFWCVNVNYTISLSRCYVCVCVCVCVGHVILTSCLHVIESNSSNTTKTKQKWYYCRSDGINHNVSSGNS